MFFFIFVCKSFFPHEHAHHFSTLTGIGICFSAVAHTYMHNTSLSAANHLWEWSIDRSICCLLPVERYTNKTNQKLSTYTHTHVWVCVCKSPVQPTNHLSIHPQSKYIGWRFSLSVVHCCCWFCCYSQPSRSSVVPPPTSTHCITFSFEALPLWVFKSRNLHKRHFCRTSIVYRVEENSFKKKKRKILA